MTPKKITAIDIFDNPSVYPRVSVLQHVIIRAVRHLTKLEALALIRGAYTTDGAFASLDEAKKIYEKIKA